jgi:hypothetical protein
MEVLRERLCCQSLSNSLGPAISCQHALGGNRDCETVLHEYIDTMFFSFNIVKWSANIDRAFALAWLTHAALGNSLTSVICRESLKS